MWRDTSHLIQGIWYKEIWDSCVLQYKVYSDSHQYKVYSNAFILTMAEAHTRFLVLIDWRMSGLCGHSGKEKDAVWTFSLLSNTFVQHDASSSPLENRQCALFKLPWLQTWICSWNGSLCCRCSDANSYQLSSRGGVLTTTCIHIPTCFLIQY